MTELERLILLFERAEAEVEKEMLRAEARWADFTAAQRRAKRLEIRAVLAALLKAALSGTNKEPSTAFEVVRQAYEEGLRNADRGPGGVGAAPIARSLSRAHTDAIEVLWENLRDRLQDAIAYVGRRADDVFRRVALDEITQGQIQGRSRRKTAGLIEQGLRNRGVRAFRDARGREWKLADYARMVSRTTAHEAATWGTLNRLAENGIDLVRIVVAPNACKEHCQRYAGKIYSISGTHPVYPPLTEAPPFHPNCTCNVVAYVEALAA